MTPKQSTARLTLYVLIAMLTAASSGIATIDFSDLRETIQFAMGVIVTGLVTARSYIDQSPNQVSLPPASELGFSPEGAGGGDTSQKL